MRPLLLASLLAVAACKSSAPDSCSQPVSCGRGSVQTCVSADGAHCSYRTSDGDTANCAACGDCSAAAQQVASWCSGDGNPSGATGGNGATPPGTQAMVCKTYLACAAVAAPSVFPQLVPVYGPNGSCWSDASLAASCAQACTRSLADLASSSYAPECHPSTDMAIAPPPPPPPPDMSRASTDMACLPFMHDCQSDPMCCAQCCAGGCVLFGYCALP